MNDSQLIDHIQQLLQLSQIVIAKMSDELVIRFELQPVEEKTVEGFKYDDGGDNVSINWLIVVI